MAENDKNVIVTTELFGYTIFGQEKKNNRRISFGLFNDSDKMYFKIARPDPDSGDSKFSKQLMVAITNSMAPWSVYGVANQMIKKIRKLEKGENLNSDSLVLHNKRSLKDATTKIEFNAFSKDGKPMILVKLSKRKDENQEWKDGTEDIFFFGTSSLYYRNKENKEPEDKEVYAVFCAIAECAHAVATKTSTTRDAHLKKYFDATNGKDSDSSEKKSSNKSSKSSSSDDEDDDEFPF